MRIVATITGVTAEAIKRAEAMNLRAWRGNRRSEAVVEGPSDRVLRWAEDLGVMDDDIRVVFE